MKKPPTVSYSILLSLSLLMAVFLFPMTGHSQGFLRASGQQIVNEQGENVLLRGIGLGGWMLQEGYMLRLNQDGQQHKIRERIEALAGPETAQAFYDAWLSNHTTRADIDSLKAWGFNSIRLPMHYNLYTLPVEKEPVAGQQTWLDKGFAMTDSLLAWCKANQLYLILDLHAAPGGQGNDLNISDRDASKPSLWESEANRQKTIALWKKLAARYAHEPAIAAYDVLNEPNWGFEDPSGDKNGLKEKQNAPLRKLLMEITTAIREVDTKHIVVIEGNGWGNNYNGMMPPWDKNMVLSFHKYWNYNDDASIKHILQYREQYNIPVWLGETGENSNVWFTEAIRLLERHNIGWAWWPLKKLGFNNPLEIPSSAGYDKLLDYWGKRSAVKPSPAEARETLMTLAQATNISKNTIHYDVIDAMIRQPHDATAKPFRANRVTGTVLLNAVDYDLGPNGVAYFDMDTANYHVSTSGKRSVGNRGHRYRNDGVDISAVQNKGVVTGAELVAGMDGDTGNDLYVSDIETGEWLQYTLDVAAASRYRLQVLVAAEKKGGELQALIDGKPVGASLAVPATGGAEQWQNIDIQAVSLSKGRHVLRLMTVKGGYQLKGIRLAAL